MYKRTFRFAFILLFTLIFASACGNISDMLSSNNDNNEENEADAEEEDNANEEANNNENNENNGEMKKIGEVEETDNDNNNDDEDNDDAKSDIDVKDSKFSDQIEYMEEETEGTAEVLFESDESQEHDMEDVSLTQEGYTFVELDDFHIDLSIPLDDEKVVGCFITIYNIHNYHD